MRRESVATTAQLSLLAAGGLAGGGAVWLAAHQPPGRPTEPGPWLTLLVGASLLGCGFGAWRARPENRVGKIMVFSGFAWFVGLLVDATPAWLNTIGLALQAAWIVGLIYLLLAFPSGRLRGRLDRFLLAGGGAVTIGLQLLAMLFGNRAGLRCPGCAGNVLQIVHDNAKAMNLLSLQRLIGVGLILTIVAVLVRRWFEAGTAERRAVAPVVVAGCATLAALGATITLDLLGDPLGSAPATVYFTMTATVPVAVLAVFLQRRLARGMVAGLVVELGETAAPVDLREALARALGDPSLQLAFWFPLEQHYVDSTGARVALPDESTGRSSTFIAREGEPIAVLLHDPVLEHNAELVASVCAAATLTLENARLQAELRARLLELQASRARLVQATDAERRRIERDLHDGTQQRLVSIAMALGLLETKLPTAGAEATQPLVLVRQTREALAGALAELRELTHGINPPVLAERGLPAALEELCGRAAMPNHLDVRIQRRLSNELETAAYFMVSEALTNAAKHSHGSEIRVFASDRGQRLTIEVADDGIGSATVTGGSGLRGLLDRIEALGGRLTISSPPGRGTLLRAEIPCA